MAEPAQKVEMIPIDSIDVINPRVRNKKIFKAIVENIANVGLKRPITVARRKDTDGAKYELVCGQGRLEAFKLLEQEKVPALVVMADREDCLVASLVENCARRHHQAVDLLSDIVGMRERGNSDAEIAAKTGLSHSYVIAISRLFEKGERRLIKAVEAGYLPISVALEICEADDQGVQAALHKAYDEKLLRGRDLIAARRLVEVRQRSGKKGSPRHISSNSTMSPQKLIKAFQEDTERKRIMIKRTEATRNRMVFITEALRQLTSDESFTALLEDEGLSTLPSRLAERIKNIREPSGR